MTIRDLSRRIGDGMPTYPGDPAVRVEPHATRGRDGYRVSELRLGSHAGTHVDAPSHTEPGGRTLGEFPIEAFEFEARLIDCRDLGARAPIELDRVRAAVGEGGDAGLDAVVFDTGWATRWGTDRALDHPYLTAETAAWCAEGGLHVATDALNVDPTPSDRAAGDEPSGVPAHHALLGAGRLVVENLRNLDDLPPRFELDAYPLSLDADGAPVRAVARVDRGTESGGGGGRAGGDGRDRA